MTLPEQDEKFKGAILDVESLRRKNARYRELNDMILETLRRLNDEMVTANREGKVSINSSIPSTFAISGLSNTKCQSIAYGTIINILEKKGYTVTIDISHDGKAIVNISWGVRDKDEGMLDAYYIKVIAKHTKQDTDHW